MKKVLSLVLVIAMVLSSMSFAFAGTFEDVTGDYTDAVEALVALNVINGYEDGTFRPGNTITRAEMAKILVEALGYGELVAGSESNFSDTQGHWANGYVAIATGIGLTVGYPDGTFKPNNPITYNEAITMVVRALGYSDATLTGTWPTNYKVKAIDLDLTDDVVMKTAAADRGGVAQLLYNALEAALVEVDEDGIVVKTGKLLIDNIATPATITVDADTLDEDSDDYAGNIIDLAPYMFQSIDVYENADDEVVYVKDVNSTVYEGKVDDLDDLGTYVELDVKQASGTIKELQFTVADTDAYVKSTTVGAADVIGIFENGETLINGAATYKFADLLKTDSIKVVYNEDKNDEDGDGSKTDDVFAGIIITVQTGVAQVDDEYVDGQDHFDAFDLPVDEDEEVDMDKVTVKGAVDSLEDIAEDDVVAEYAAFDGSEMIRTTLVVCRDTVEGKVTRVSNDTVGTKYYIDGVAYKLNGATVALGDEGTFFLDHNGKIVATDTTTAEATDYAVVVDIGNGKVTTDAFNKVSIDDYPLVKLATADNEVVTFEIYVTLNDAGTAVEDGASYVSLSGSSLVIDTTKLNDGFLVKYGTNDDGQIDIATKKADTLTFDQDKVSFKLASNAVIFDGTDTTGSDAYPVVSADALDETGTASAVAYNSNGEIVAMITTSLDSESESYYAYVTKAEKAYDDDDDEVRLVTAYLNGAKVEYLTDDASDIAADAVNAVKVFTLSGEVIETVSDFPAADVTTGAAVASVSTSTNSFVVGTTRYFLADGATILEKETAEDGTVSYIISDLYDIDDETVTIYQNAADEVVYIMFED